MTRRKPTANSPSRHASGPAKGKGSRADSRHGSGGKPGPKPGPHKEQGGKPPARYGDAPRGERGEGGDRPPSRQGFGTKPGFGAKPGFGGGKPAFGAKKPYSGGKPGFGSKPDRDGGRPEGGRPDGGRGPRRDDRAPEYAPRPGRDAAGERLERPDRSTRYAVSSKPGGKPGPKKDFGGSSYAGRMARFGADDRKTGDRKTSDRPAGDRPRGDRPNGDRPYGDRPYSDRKAPPRDFDRDSGPKTGPKKVHRDARPPARAHGERREEGGRPPARFGNAPRPERGGPERGAPRFQPAPEPVDDFDDDDFEPIVAPSAKAGAEKSGTEKSGRRSGIRTDQWLYGSHAVLAALANPRRHCDRLVLTDTMAEHLGTKLETLGGPQAEILMKEEIERLLPPGAVHQGIAVAVEPLEEPDLPDILEALPPGRGLVVILDQVTDPHNVGAVLRSAAAFGADAVILPDRHAPGATGVLAKAASGALDAIPLLHVVNLSRTMDDLKAAGFWCVGFDSEAGQPVAAADMTGRVVLVLGAEGAGLRRLTRERCDLLVRLPTQGNLLSLNVSNAAAVALYEVARRR